MIRIAKSAAIPKPLNGATSSGGKATQKLIDAFVAGKALPKIRSAVYGHALVRKQLFQDQHFKCVFCESRIKETMYGDVEHFRPKGGWKQNASDVLQQPGYYWLAYEWSNLTLSCQLCNQEYKKNHFPLLNPKRRAKSHLDDFTREQPVLVDPTRENPEEFIEFHEEVARGIDAQGRGLRTIEILKLDRFDEVRRDHLTTVRRMQRVVKSFEGVPMNPEQAAAVAECQAFLAECQEDGAVFAAMCRCAVKDTLHNVR